MGVFVHAGRSPQNILDLPDAREGALSSRIHLHDDRQRLEELGQEGVKCDESADGQLVPEDHQAARGEDGRDSVATTRLGRAEKNAPVL